VSPLPRDQRWRRRWRLVLMRGLVGTLGLGGPVVGPVIGRRPRRRPDQRGLGGVGARGRASRRVAQIARVRRHPAIHARKRDDEGSRAVRAVAVHGRRRGECGRPGAGLVVGAEQLERDRPTRGQAAGQVRGVVNRRAERRRWGGRGRERRIRRVDARRADDRYLGDVVASRWPGGPVASIA